MHITDRAYNKIKDDTLRLIIADNMRLAITIYTGLDYHRNKEAAKDKIEKMIISFLTRLDRLHYDDLVERKLLKEAILIKKSAQGKLDERIGAKAYGVYDFGDGGDNLHAHLYLGFAYGFDIDAYVRNWFNSGIRINGYDKIRRDGTLLDYFLTSVYQDNELGTGGTGTVYVSKIRQNGLVLLADDCWFDYMSKGRFKMTAEDYKLRCIYNHSGWENKNRWRV